MVDLPRYEGEYLDRSPLVLVAAQINFEEVGREVTHKQARDIQKAVDGHWTHLAPMSLVTTTVTPTGAVNEAPRQAYRLSNQDGTWSALLNPDGITIETRAYPGWADFRATIESFARAVVDVFDPANEARMGVRYVDQVPLPEGKDGWEGLVPDSLLGVAQDARLGSGVLASDQRVLLQLAPDVRCVLRHGLLADAAGAFGQVYLLDFDVFRENAGPYSLPSLMEGADSLHALAGSVFRASITDDLYKWLKG